MMMPQYSQPMMPQQFPMPYPQQMPMMGQPYGAPMMMPQQYPQFPQPVQMAPQQYAPPETAQPQADERASSKPPELDVRLPKPEETGAVEPQTEKRAAESKTSSGVDPRAAAADIIRQYTHRPLGQ